DGGEWTGGDNRTATIEEETTLNDVFGLYIYNVALATAPFYAGDDVTITWSSYGVDNVKIEAWIPTEGIWDELIASTPSDGTEDFSIPEDAWNDNYQLRISDVTNAAVNAVSAEFEVIARPSIYEIQSNTSDGDLSDYDGQKVQVSGVVTAIAGSNFWIQTPPLKDSQYPEWSAIFAYDATTAAALAIGDDVTLEATVDEYYNATELVSVTSSTINSQGNTIAAVAVTAAAALESYESTLITIMGAEVTSEADSYGEFTINDGTADYTVDDKIFAYTPTLGEVLDVTGVVAFSYGAFKLYPRDADDITVASGVGIDDLSASSISVYPNPSNGKFYVQMGDAFKVNTKIEVFNIVGMKVFETLSNNFKTEIDLSTMKQGVYYVRVDDGENIITQKIMKQ
ncbi:MAG: T9SS type A sorting domain-containing protein, partial [Bacteroidales bacterium]|nr:T9SS type A sorting domain-containing protein [Bacteroidales bacterium]